MRISLLIREFARLSGEASSVRIGSLIAWKDMEPLRDRKDLIRLVYDRVFALAPEQPPRHRAMRKRLWRDRSAFVG